MHFYLISCFHDHCSHFKQIREKCDKNISNKKYERFTKYLYKTKESNQTVLGKGLFFSIKGHCNSTKGHLDNSERQVEVESLQTGIHFETFDSN